MCFKGTVLTCVMDVSERLDNLQLPLVKDLNTKLLAGACQEISIQPDIDPRSI